MLIINCDIYYFQLLFISYCFLLIYLLIEKKEILHRVNGKFPGGQLIAIMGPSGAGKSTLLDVLSGYRKTNVNGAVYLNGRIRDLNQFRKMSCYITQDDRLQALLTVHENMQIAADLKLDSSMRLHEKEMIVSIYFICFFTLHEKSIPDPGLPNYPYTYGM